MEQFRTIVSPSGRSPVLFQNTPILTLGSCFSDAMGKQLQDNKFQVKINPFGVIYNPISLHQVLRYTVLNEMPPASTFVLNQEVYRNFDFHSSFAALTREECERAIQLTINTLHAWIPTCQVILLTYGTAWVYTETETNHIVANCHKVPAAKFNKRLLSSDEVIASFKDTLQLLRKLNPELKIVLTVSPVRHIKDTLALNGVSKAILRTACHIQAEQSGVEYFPAYEIMMDDLRDYRFYKPDMIHPTEQAEDYIWERFSERFIGDRELAFISTWKNIQAALRHKPFHAGTSGHKNFLKDVLEKLEKLNDVVNVEEELKAVKAQLEDVKINTP